VVGGPRIDGREVVGRLAPDAPDPAHPGRRARRGALRGRGLADPRPPGDRPVGRAHPRRVRLCPVGAGPTCRVALGTCGDLPRGLRSHRSAAVRDAPGVRHPRRALRVPRRVARPHLPVARRGARRGRDRRGHRRPRARHVDSADRARRGPPDPAAAHRGRRNRRRRGHHRAHSVPGARAAARARPPGRSTDRERVDVAPARRDARVPRHRSARHRLLGRDDPDEHDDARALRPHAALDRRAGGLRRGPPWGAS